MRRRKERRHESSVPTGYGYHPHYAHDLKTATLRPPTPSHNRPPTSTPKAHTPILSSSPHVHTSSLPCYSKTAPAADPLPASHSAPAADPQAASHLAPAIDPQVAPHSALSADLQAASYSAPATDTQAPSYSAPDADPQVASSATNHPASALPSLCYMDKQDIPKLDPCQLRPLASSSAPRCLYNRSISAHHRKPSHSV